MGRENPDDGTVIPRIEGIVSRNSFWPSAKRNAFSRGIDHAKGCPAAPLFSENEMPFRTNFHATKVLNP